MSENIQIRSCVPSVSSPLVGEMFSPPPAMTAGATCLSRYTSPTSSADVPPGAEFKAMHKLCHACCVKPGNRLDLSPTSRYKSSGLEWKEEENVAPQSSTLCRALLILLLRLMLNHLCCNDPDHNLRGWCYRKHKKHPCEGGGGRGSMLTDHVFTASVNGCLKGNTKEETRGGSAGGENTFV